jgi:hypothetical protein
MNLIQQYLKELREQDNNHHYYDSQTANYVTTNVFCVTLPTPKG